MVDNPGIINYAKFGHDRFKSSGVAGAQILPFPTDFDRCPYNSHTAV